MKSKRFLLISVVPALISSILITISVLSYRAYLLTPNPVHLDSEAKKHFNAQINESSNLKGIRQLPYPIVQAELDINATSAILIDVSNGCILFEKNADQIIPPASMIKLVAMYVVFSDIASGKIKLSDNVPLPPECWVENMPSDASLMFLYKNQEITLEELLKGMAVASGNDAAIAVAYYTAGNEEAFSKRMNDVVNSLGLTHTYFEEPSGYSEKNVTTARDFIVFAREYLNLFPQALNDYHSLREYTYTRRPDGKQITLRNTNKLLGQINGVDGLKTGFINESGYNLALTVIRNKTRFLSITMGGPGRNSIEGNKYRLSDAQTLIEWAYSVFTTVKEPVAPIYVAIVSGGVNNALYLYPAWNRTISVPHINGINSETLPEDIILDCNAQYVHTISAPVVVGAEYGKIIYSYKGTVLEEVPMIADRTIPKAFFFKQLIDRLVLGE